MENLFLTSLTVPEIRQIIREEFSQNQTATPQTVTPAKILNGEELSKELGITVQTLMKWREKGRIPYFKIGSAIRYDLNKVLETLEVKKKGATK